MVSPDSRAYRARRQAETPLIVLFRFPEPALVADQQHSYTNYQVKENAHWRGSFEKYK
jgi:hypothetical protein